MSYTDPTRSAEAKAATLSRRQNRAYKANPAATFTRSGHVRSNASQTFDVRF